MRCSKGKALRLSLGIALLAPMLLAATPEPVHHLKYAFAVYDAEQSSAASAGRFSGPDSGVVDVAFLGAAADGGTNVRATERWWNELRPEQSVACELYPNGHPGLRPVPGSNDD